MSGPLQPPTPPSPGSGRAPTGPLEPPAVPRSPWWHLRWAVPLAVLLVYGVYFFAGSSWGTRAYWFDRCSEGVWQEGPHDECVGVTDGRFAFDDSVADVSRLVHQENQRVEKSGKPWVSVVYMHPMTSDDTGRDDNSARQELEGAYLAQRELNDPAVGGYGELPQIRLLIANPGSGARQWQPVADRLLDMKDDERHKLVAVTGFGPSWGSTKQAIKRLRADGLPLVGGASTADDLTDGKEGFFRVVNPNEGEAFAAARLLRQLQREERDYRVVVVKDRSESDLYPTSLYEGFSKAAKEQGLKLEPLLSYSSDKAALPDAFSGIAESVCQDKPDALYFAGRGRELRQFITAMGSIRHRCEVEVFTGDDAVSMYADSQESLKERNKFTEQWRKSRVIVRFTAVAHPDLWREGYPGKKNEDPVPEFTKRYTEFTGRGAEQLDDGQVIAVRDAVFVAGAAIREAGPKDVTASAVWQLLLGFKERNAVPGLSGPIHFDEDGDPVAKRVPMVELEPSGAYTFWKGVQP